ncbi:hypothetical protein C8R45DRAFT_850724, partial [Mycena sanguinolenta]
LPIRPSTRHKLKKVREDMARTFEQYVSDENIWSAVRAKEILPRASQFLWKGLHNAQRIGHYWMHIPECEDCAMCHACGVTEDLKHILTKCTSPGQEIIWKAAKDLWLMKEDKWPDVSLGTILGCGLAEFRDERGRQKRGTQRLYRILMSESAHLVWLIRNDRVISRSGEPFVPAEILNKWNHNINLRLQVNQMLANCPLRGKHPSLAPKLVLDTWSGVLQLENERALPENWLREPRVLVGSRATPQPVPRHRQNNGVR